MGEHYAVYKTDFGYERRPIIKSSALRVTVDHGHGRQGHIEPRKVLARLPEAAAAKLLERLISSRALMRDEQTKSAERHIEREKKLVAQSEGEAA